jgi:UDP-N-acetylglucosamine 2-epimerase (non-hydrolysing)
MKMAPVVQEMQRRRLPHLLVHTGQHYDRQMSDIFFEELGMPAPDISLGVGSGSHGEQTAKIMIAFEQVCNQQKFELVVVGGDVNSTLACALVAAKLNIPVAHVEAGLRSFDRSMPEEINRVLTDHLAELLFTTEEDARKNLQAEGIPERYIHFVGNCMVDTLLKNLDTAVTRSPWEAFGLKPQSYALLTLHRPANVDDKEQLTSLLAAIGEASQSIPFIFPVHPRTRERLAKWGIPVASSMILTEPLPYLSFLGLMARSSLVLTDSGGIQEETTILQVPCLTLRPNTERPVTISLGTNRLVGANPEDIKQAVAVTLEKGCPGGQRPPLWDGKASLRIVDIIQKWHPFCN